MRKIETDVIVVAAGLSGLAASVAAAESGVRVTTFEKSNTTGGAANMGMGAGCRITHSAGADGKSDSGRGIPQAYVFYSLSGGCKIGKRLLF